MYRIVSFVKNGEECEYMFGFAYHTHEDTLGGFRRNESQFQGRVVGTVWPLDGNERKLFATCL